MKNICATIKKVSFKAFVTGHGRTCTNYLDLGWDNRDVATICGLPPQLCSDMLQCFHDTNIKTIVLSSCQLGVANRYFLQRTHEKTATGLRWNETQYSFNLIIKGITDLSIGIGDLQTKFFNSELTENMSPEKIISLLTSDEIGPVATTCLQILPAHQKSFQVYENENITVIDEQKESFNSVIGQKNICIYGDVNTSLTFDATRIFIYFMTTAKERYEFEKIVLSKSGVKNFINNAFRYVSPMFPKTIMIKHLEGIDDTNVSDQPTLQPRTRGKKIVCVKQNKKTIILKNVTITAKGLSQMDQNDPYGDCYIDTSYTYDEQLNATEKEAV